MMRYLGRGVGHWLPGAARTSIEKPCLSCHRPFMAAAIKTAGDF